MRIEHQTKKIFTQFLLIVFLSMFLFSEKAGADWREPGVNCNPNVDPYSSDCNVSPPLNTSAAPQTKDGKLTVKDLVVTGTLTVSGGLQIPSNSVGTAQIINESILGEDIQNGTIGLSDVQSGIFITTQGGTIQGNLTIVPQNGAGLTVSASNDGAGIYATTSTLFPAINARSAGNLGSAAGTFHSDNTAALIGTTNASGQSAIYGEASQTLSYGLKGCNKLGYCASLGGEQLAAFIDGPTQISRGTLTVNNDASVGGTLTTNNLVVTGNFTLPAKKRTVPLALLDWRIDGDPPTVLGGPSGASLFITNYGDFDSIVTSTTGVYLTAVTTVPKDFTSGLELHVLTECPRRGPRSDRLAVRWVPLRTGQVISLQRLQQEENVTLPENCTANSALESIIPLDKVTAQAGDSIRVDVGWYSLKSQQYFFGMWLEYSSQ